MDQNRKRDPKDKSENDRGQVKRARLYASDVTTSTSVPFQDEFSNCAQCASLNVLDLFNALAEQGQSGQIAYLGTLDSPESQRCRGCKLFASVKSLDTSGGRPKPQSLYVHPVLKSEIWGRNGSVLVVASKDSEGDLDYQVETRGAIACCYGSPLSPRSLVARQIHTNRINFADIRQWISLCMSHHNKCNRYASNVQAPVGMKLIDCNSRQIVPAQSHRYVALSYVWGLDQLGSEYDDQPKHGRLANNLPQTIEDAIVVSTKLGYGYIWIDRYCIDQNNAAEKQSQIWQMNTIYRNAQVTIMAVAGKDPRFGLPGISTRPRVAQPSAYIGGGHFTSITPHPMIALCESKWNERGWTYQEGYFSIRRLAFFEDQVYFSCYNAAAVETIHHLTHEAVPYAVYDKDNGDQEAFEIHDHLIQYSGKHLTRDSDAINAVAGVFNDHGTFKYGVTPQYLGVPIVCFSQFDKFTSQGQRRRKTDAFLIGLSWQNREPGRRRNIWPSWTWAEWAVRFDYGDAVDGRAHDAFTLSTDFVVRPQAFLETINGARLDLEDKGSLDLAKRSPASLSKFIWIESWTYPLEIQIENPEQRASSANSLLSPLDRSNDSDDKAVAKFFAYFMARDVCHKFRFWPMEPDFKNKLHIHNRSQRPGRGEKGEILGIVLSRAVLTSNRWCHTIMVVQNKGTYFERIGHCIIKSEQIEDLATRSGGKEDEWVFGWKKYHETTARLCTKYLTRRFLRIG